MTIEKSEAAAALDDIASIVERVKQSTFYRNAGAILVMWGVLVACGYLATYLMPARGGLIWIALHIAGTGGTIALLRRQRLQAGHVLQARGAADLRALAALAIFFGFGLLWSVVLGRMGAREMGAFWPTLFMFGYTLAGLWFGRAFIALGLTITALTVVGYVWAGPLFEPYMAVVDGGGLILCGLWMRRA